MCNIFQLFIELLVSIIIILLYLVPMILFWPLHNNVLAIIEHMISVVNLVTLPDHTVCVRASRYVASSLLNDWAALLWYELGFVGQVRWPCWHTPLMMRCQGSLLSLGLTNQNSVLFVRMQTCLICYCLYELVHYFLSCYLTV